MIKCSFVGYITTCTGVFCNKVRLSPHAHLDTAANLSNDFTVNVICLDINTVTPSFILP